MTTRNRPPRMRTIRREIVDPDVVVHTDGCCLGNPGDGGYGIVFNRNGRRSEMSAGFRNTTNNRMELLACIVALESLNSPGRVVIYSDSKYVVDAMRKGWVRKWQANNWMRNKRDPALNVDLWLRLLEQCEKHAVEFRWVRGHSGNKENEKCDQLAREAAREKNLQKDEGYGTSPRRGLL